MFLSVWTKIGKYTRYSSSFRAEMAVDRMACQRRAVKGNIWYLKQLGFRLSVYDVVLGRGTYNSLREDRFDTAGSKDTGELHARDSRRYNNAVRLKLSIPWSQRYNRLPSKESIQLGGQVICR